MQIAITNRGSNQIQPEIIKQMNNAQRSIWIAVAWFTDREIYNVLIEKLKQGVKIRLIALYDDINQEKGVDFDTLSRNGAQVYLTQDDFLIQQKYCIIDSQTVIMGSYNYTKAAQSQRESVIVSKHENQIVTEFEADFNYILKEYFNKEEECPLTMEWWNGLLQYGNLQYHRHHWGQKPNNLTAYNWQDIFMVHLIFLEKGIVLNNDIIGIGAKYENLNCFEIYRQEFKIPFIPNSLKITQQELNKIYQINSLQLYKSAINTLNPLQKLKNLQELCCNTNEIRSLEPLQELKNLQKLCCGGDYINSLKPLQGLKKLEFLNCGGNYINSLEPLQELKNLQELNCFGNEITSLEPLRELKNLQTLCCANNQINSLAPLWEFKNLQRLDCDGNQISGLETQQFEKEHQNCIVVWETFTFD